MTHFKKSLLEKNMKKDVLLIRPNFALNFNLGAENKKNPAKKLSWDYYILRLIWKKGNIF